MSDEYFYVRFRFSAKIGVPTGPTPGQQEAVVEVPMGLVLRKKSEFMNENPREKAIALDFARRAALAYFQAVSNGLHGRMMKMRFGVKIAIPSRTSGRATMKMMASGHGEFH